LTALSAHAEVGYYTTALAVADLEAVRRALGYDRINLYGVSYGTRVAQQYLRRHAATVRALILDGVVPPTLIVGPAMAEDAQGALTRIFARCTREAGCGARFGNPAEDYEMLRRHLQPGPVAVTVPDPRSGQATPLNFGWEHLGTVLRLGGYSADYA